MLQEMWIGGEFVPASSGETFAVENPYTEQIIAHVPAGTAADAGRAVDAALEAFEQWRRIPAVQRADYLHEIARRLRAAESRIARQMSLEGGKPLVENLDEVGWSAACFDYYAELGRHSRGRVIPSIEPSQLSLVLKEPYGVVACIVPWN